jgi:hypothetical protein
MCAQSRFDLCEFRACQKPDGTCDCGVIRQDGGYNCVGLSGQEPQYYVDCGNASTTGSGATKSFAQSCGVGTYSSCTAGGCDEEGFSETYKYYSHPITTFIKRVPQGGACTFDAQCAQGVYSQGTCISGVCGCIPGTATSCPDHNADCGTIPDGCGGTINCGGCSLPQFCGGSGWPNICGGCMPTTCAAQGKNCGTISDGCGGKLTCGSCAKGLRCGHSVPNVCG